MKHFPKTFAIVDTETTGMRPPYSRIIDIGIIRIENGKEVDKFQSLINPGTSIPSSIKRFTHITDKDLGDAPPFEDVALRVQEMLSGAVFVAHNVAFDYSFLKSEFSRLGMPFSPERLCSVQLSRALYPHERSHSLESIINRYDISVEARHRALPDAEAVWQFFSHVSKTLPSTHIKEALERIGRRRTGRLAPDHFKELPDSSGVYFFHGPDQELLYIGKSKHIRTRARSHFNAANAHKEAHIQKETETVTSVSTSGELSALILEALLIKKESPVYNRALRKRKTLVVATPVTDTLGYRRVALERTDASLPGENALSLFKTLTQGKETLRRLSKEYTLCNKLLGVEQGVGACFGYQLGTCNGACVGKESPETYNVRIEEAFAKRKIRTWPYKGTILITERESAERGTVFFIDNWALLGAFTYDDDMYEPLDESLNTSNGFDYDTYKILVRYLLAKRNARSIRSLTPTEYKKQWSVCTGSFESVLERDFSDA
jgi:DNA polymerase-3 subunit epsilon